MVRLTRAQVREIDKRSIERYHIPGIVLMENAARAVADAAWEMVKGKPAAIFILCGGGNNGGDGLAAARHLHNGGADVTIYLLSDPARFKGDAKTNFEIIDAMPIAYGDATLERFTGKVGPALIIDAAFGTGLTSEPRAPFGDLVTAINRRGPPVLAVDLPSGLDCDTGNPLGACIRATKTVTFVAEKTGFANPKSMEYTGEVIVGDIGCPRELIDEVIRDIHE